MKKLVINCKTAKQTKKKLTEKELQAMEVEHATEVSPSYDDEAKTAILQEFPVDKQLDAIWEQFNQMRLQGQPLIQQVDDMLGGIKGVKTRIKNRRKKDGK